jgi:transposase
LVEQLQNLQPHLGQLYALSQQFVRLVEKQTSPRAGGGAIGELAKKGRAARQSGTQPLRQRYRAGQSGGSGGLSSEWSNGQVEGQVNRLKMLKRQMFGRVGFGLLKAHILPAA